VSSEQPLLFARLQEPQHPASCYAPPPTQQAPAARTHLERDLKLIAGQRLAVGARLARRHLAVRTGHALVGHPVWGLGVHAQLVGGGVEGCVWGLEGRKAEAGGGRRGKGASACCFHAATAFRFGKVHATASHCNHREPDATEHTSSSDLLVARAIKSVVSELGPCCSDATILPPWRPPRGGGARPLLLAAPDARADTSDGAGASVCTAIGREATVRGEEIILRLAPPAPLLLVNPLLLH